MDNREVFRIWAPSSSKWSKWVKPVPFISMSKVGLDISEKYENDTVSSVDFDKDTALIIDLPGMEGIKEAIVLAKKGYRPVPIYNGTIPQENAISNVDTTQIQSGLILEADKLEKIKLLDDAPPAFMIDSNRTNMFKMSPSIFDNSWDLYDQDIPSSKYLLNAGVKKIIVISSKLQRDLKPILFNFQKQGLEIYLADTYKEPRKIVIKKLMSKYLFISKNVI